MKVRKQFVHTNQHKRNRIRVHGNHRNKYTAQPVELTADQFDKLYAEHRSLVKIARHLKISDARVFQLAHQLFPDRQFSAGPPRKFLVEEAGAVRDGVTRYTIRLPTEAPVAAQEVHWDGQAAHCQGCVSTLRRDSSSSCSHARAVRRYVLEGRLAIKDELLRLALVYAEQDRRAMAEAAHGLPEGVEARALADRFHTYRMQRWGRTQFEADVAGAKTVDITTLRGNRHAVVDHIK